MNPVIIYMSSHGCAEKAASLIIRNLPDNPLCINLEHQPPPDLTEAGLIIIGGSVRMGSIQKRIQKFCDKNLSLLLQKQVGLYICCMYEGEKAKEQLRKNFPEKLVAHATALGIFGGELDFAKLSSFEQMIIRDIIGITRNVSLFREEPVRDFCNQLGIDFRKGLSGR